MSIRMTPCLRAWNETLLPWTRHVCVCMCVCVCARMLPLPSAITDVAQVRGFGEHVHVRALVAGSRVMFETEASLPES